MKHTEYVRGADDPQGIQLVATNHKLKIISQPGIDSTVATGASEVRNFCRKILYMGIRYCWDNLKPRLAQSEGADYWECYDRETDNNGYMTFVPQRLVINAAFPDTGSMYVFNKFEFQSFMYDVLVAFPDLQQVVGLALTDREVGEDGVAHARA